jgi:hypothetical protein
MNSYECSVCGIAVIVIPNEKPIKACNCEGVILANIDAVVIRNESIFNG